MIFNSKMHPQPGFSRLNSYINSIWLSKKLTPKGPSEAAWGFTKVAQGNWTSLGMKGGWHYLWGQPFRKGDPEIKFYIFWWSDMSMISTLNILDGWMGDFLNICCIYYSLFSADGNSFADHWILCGTRIVFWFVCSIDYVCFYLVLKTKCDLRLVCSVYQCFVSGKFRYARWQMLLFFFLCRRMDTST